jgi:serine/threonine protein kinase
MESKINNLIDEYSEPITTNKIKLKVNRTIRNSVKKSCFLTPGEYLSDFTNDAKFELRNFDFLKLDNQDHIIDTGAMGDVLLAKNKLDKKFYAIKKIDKEMAYLNGFSYELIINEINIHRRIYHENIISMVAHHETEREFYLITEYASGGNLASKLSSKLSEQEAFFYFIQTVNAVNFLHENNLIHRDLKPENILLDDEGQVKLCDFGWCVESKDSKRMTVCGTCEYMAPEVIKNIPYNDSIDIWSLGVLLYELVHGNSPFCSENYDSNTIYKNILRKKVVFSENVSENCKDLISSKIILI